MQDSLALLRLTLTDAARATLTAGGMAAEAARFAAGRGPLRCTRTALSVEAGLAYLYWTGEGTTDASGRATLAQDFARAHAWVADAEAVWLEAAFDAPGASAGKEPVFHYVVETDTDDGWFDEIVRWYDTEHMPGLASVPGCVRARRFINQEGGPRSFACYDLLSRETLGSPPWLAVRGTAWSDIARPHFVNTRRTMFVAA